MRRVLLAACLLSLAVANTAPAGSAGHPAGVVMRAPKGKSVAQTLAMMGIASKFYAGLKTARLDSVLNLPKAQYTVFAPTNDGFGRLEEKGVALATATTKGLDQHQLDLLLRFHVVPGRYPTEVLKTGQTLRTLNGAFNIKVSMQGAKTWVAGLNTAPVELGNAYILCDNGVIHLIDDVMVPFARQKQAANPPVSR